MSSTEEPTEVPGPDQESRPVWWNALRRKLKAVAEIYEGIAMTPYRAEIQRRYARQRDAFLLATFSDALGVPNPTEFYTMELMPYLMEEFHEWHQRIGMDHPPEGGWRCC